MPDTHTTVTDTLISAVGTSSRQSCILKSRSCRATAVTSALQPECLVFFSLHQTACLLPLPPQPDDTSIDGSAFTSEGRTHVHYDLSPTRRRSVSHGDERRRKCRFQCRGLFLRREAAITFTRSWRGFCALNPTGPLCVCVVRENGARDTEPRSPFPPGRLVEACQAAPPAFEKLSALPATNFPSPPQCLSAFHEARRHFP